MNALVLIAEDEPKIAEVLELYLVREGFRTITARDGQTAVDLHTTLRPDLVLLDVGLPRKTGWEVLSDLRHHADTPVIMITALDQDIDKLQALRIGADDYVVKPFNPLEVVARVQALLRRSATRSPPGVVRLGKLEIDFDAHRVYVAREGVRTGLDLTLTEFRLLSYLARPPGRVASRSTLVDACLPGQDALEKTVDSHMSKLRRKLRTVDCDGMLQVVRGVGYLLEPSLS